MIKIFHPKQKLTKKFNKKLQNERKKNMFKHDRIDDDLGKENNFLNFIVSK